MIEQVDKTAIDELQYDQLKHGDPLGKNNRKRVAHYYDDWGAALYPEERRVGEEYKGEIDKTLTTQRGALDTLDTEYQTQLASGERQAAGLLAQARNNLGQTVSSIPSISRVPVTVYSDGFEKPEHTYYIESSAAAKLFADYPDLVAHDASSGGYNVNSKGYGKELHQALIDAEQQTTDVINQGNSIRNAVQSSGERQIAAAQSQLDTQRTNMTNSYNQTRGQINQQINFTEGLWKDYIKDMQTSFVQGIQSNTGGIKSLIDSGALEITGKVV